jgi:hypothetical protein
MFAVNLFPRVMLLKCVMVFKVNVLMMANYQQDIHVKIQLGVQACAIMVSVWYWNHNVL